MMSQGRWIPGVTPIQLANQWGVTQEVVIQLSRRASATLRTLCVMTPEFKKTVEAECLQTFRTIRTFALAKASQSSEQRQESMENGVRTIRIDRAQQNVAPLLDVALRATRALGLYTGVEPDARRAHDDDKAHDPFEGWSREEIEDYASGRRQRRALPQAVGAFETIGEELDDEESDAPVH